MWYYADGSNRQGPLEASDIDRLIAEGTIFADTLVWREGMTGWEAASKHFNMQPRPLSPPPIPAAPNAGTYPQMPPQAHEVHTAAQTGELGDDGLYIHAPSRTFGEAISTCFSKFVTFKGRASRSEYWFWILFTAILGIVASIVDAAVFPGQIDVSPINSVVSLALLLPSISVSVRRLHDIDRTGWWIGMFYLLLLGFGVIVGIVVAGSTITPGTDPNDGLIALFGIGGVVAVIYAIVILIFTLQKGTLGPNRFG